MVLSEDDVHAMMKSVGIGPHGRISYTGTHCVAQCFSTFLLQRNPTQA